MRILSAIPLLRSTPARSRRFDLVFQSVNLKLTVSAQIGTIPQIRSKTPTQLPNAA